MSDILLVEDSESMATAYMAYLQRGGYNARHVMTAEAAMKAVAEKMPRAVILDVELPDGSGVSVLHDMHRMAPDLVAIMITAHGTVETAVEAMQAGAADFITKPFTGQRLLVTLANALEKRSLQTELAERMAEDGDGFGPFIGKSAPMQAVYRTLRHVAASKVPVFITGESGTGKERAAQALHQFSPRRSEVFKAINCGAIPDNLLESELFGYMKGAFTGAMADRIGAIPAADGGTLLLDEVCEMPLDLQVKLLRALQTGTVQPVGSNNDVKVDVRFLAATNRDPLAEVKAGRFREDLYYRLFVVPLEMPPLRTRGDDVVLLAQFFLQRAAKEENKRFSGFSEDAVASLRRAQWPGNVRQLENAVRYAAATKPGGEITAADMPAMDKIVAVDVPAVSTVILPLAVMEEQAIRAALRSTDDDVTRAAALLGVNPSTVYRKLQTWQKSAS